MRFLLMCELSWRAIGRLLGVILFVLAGLGLLALVVSVKAAVIAGIGLVALISAVVKALKGDE
jgi:hypothetical protein